MSTKIYSRALNRYESKSLTVTLENPKNNELWLCDDFTKRRNIDGVEFVEVYKPDNMRRVWINLGSVKVKKARKP
jgi:hypothetical protein